MNNYYSKLFNTRFYEGIKCYGFFDFPYLYSPDIVPSNLISFPKAVGKQSFLRDGFVHFYCHDREFARFFNKPWKYFGKLSNFQGVISPDCSIVYNAPLFLQLDSIYANRLMASWLYAKGFTVIPNIRWGIKGTFEFAFEGIQPNGTVSVGSHGCIKNKEKRCLFYEGYEAMLKHVNPKTVLCYGKVTNNLYDISQKYNVKVIGFESQTSKAHGGEKYGCCI